MTVTEQNRRDEAEALPRERRPSGPPASEASVPQRRKIKQVVLIVLGVLGLILLAGVVVVVVLFRHDVREARSRLASIPTTTYESKYGDIQYRVVGDGPTVLVSHGITGGVDHAEYLVTRWRNFDERYRFVYVSRFGYLKSSLPDGATPRLQAAAYRDLLDHLGIDDVSVVGNSAGGASAMWFAIDYPERTNGLILLSSAVPGPQPDPIPRLVREHDLIYWAAIKFAPDTLIGLLLPKEVRATLTDEQKDFIVENALHGRAADLRTHRGNRLRQRALEPRRQRRPLRATEDSDPHLPSDRRSPRAPRRARNGAQDPEQRVHRLDRRALLVRAREGDSGRNRGVHRKTFE